MENLMQAIDNLRSELSNLKNAGIIGINFYDLWESHDVDVHLSDHKENILFMEALPAAYEYKINGGFIHFSKIEKGVRYTLLRECNLEKMLGKQLEVYADELLHGEE